MTIVLIGIITDLIFDFSYFCIIKLLSFAFIKEMNYVVCQYLEVCYSGRCLTVIAYPG